MTLLPSQLNINKSTRQASPRKNIDASSQASLMPPIAIQKRRIKKLPTSESHKRCH